MLRLLRVKRAVSTYLSPLTLTISSKRYCPSRHTPLQHHRGIKAATRMTMNHPSKTTSQPGSAAGGTVKRDRPITPWLNPPHPI